MSTHHPASCHRTVLIAAFALCCSVTGSVVAAADMPTVQFVTGEVSIIHADGVKAPARKGDVIRPGDRLVTGPKGMAQIRALDQGVVALRPDSECEFKPAAEGFDVALTRGQLRAVSDFAGQKDGIIHVLTPDSRIAVGNGDIETGVRPGTGGNGSETFSKVLIGDVKLKDAKGTGLVALQPGQLVKTGNGASIPVTLNTLPSFMTHTLVPPTAAIGGISGTTLGPLTTFTPRTEISVPPAVAGTYTPSLGGLLGSRTLNAGVGSLAGNANPDSAMVKIPEVKVNIATATVDGGSASVNQSLATLPVFNTGRVGSTDRTLTPGNAADLALLKPTEVVTLTTTSAELPNGQTITVIKPPPGSSFASGDTVTDVIVIKSDPVAPPASSSLTVVNNQSISNLNNTNVINPKAQVTGSTNLVLLPKTSITSQVLRK